MIYRKRANARSGIENISSACACRVRRESAMQLDAILRVSQDSTYLRLRIYELSTIVKLNIFDVELDVVLIDKISILRQHRLRSKIFIVIIGIGSTFTRRLLDFY